MEEGGHLEICPNYRDGYAEWGMTRGFAPEAWLWFLSKRVDFYKFTILAKQDAFLGSVQSMASGIGSELEYNGSVGRFHTKMRDGGGDE